VTVSIAVWTLFMAKKNLSCLLYLKVEIDVHVLSESGGVVVSVCPGVAERLQDVV
jgi:hypothetical protein